MPQSPQTYMPSHVAIITLCLCVVIHSAVTSATISKNEKITMELIFPPTIVCIIAILFKNNKNVLDWFRGFMFTWSVFSVWILSVIMTGNELGAYTLAGVFALYFWHTMYGGGNAE